MPSCSIASGWLRIGVLEELLVLRAPLRPPHVRPMGEQEHRDSSSAVTTNVAPIDDRVVLYAQAGRGGYRIEILIAHGSKSKIAR